MDYPLNAIRGIGPKRIRALADAGIRTVRDLLLYFPRDYRDLTSPKSLCDIRPGEEAAVRVEISSKASEYRSGRLCITRARVSDGTATVPVVFYNQPWMKENLVVGRELLLYGRFEVYKGKIQLTCPSIEQEEVIEPVYRPIPGLPAKMIRQAMEAALRIMEGQWPDELPERLRLRYQLAERNFAMRNAHFPQSPEALRAARRRLAFEELLLYQVALSLSRGGAEPGVRCEFADGAIEAYWRGLPFPPTDAQRRVLEEIAGDLRSARPMARLLQGDVGSGKTAVAFGAIALAAGCGYQSALMAPTEVLARQHYEGAKALFEPMGRKVGLLTGSLTARQHREAHEAISAGEWDIVVGTHALITESVRFKRLGLVITDEQHRFGVRQRAQLGAKGERVNVLVMSATPIPRTLALILYGDLDLSILDQLPPGRTPIKTRVVPQDKREDMYGFVRREVLRGRQAYVVCPLVEESEAVDALSAEALYKELKENLLRDVRVEMVHGRMKPADKEAALSRFREREADVLVSTTVIEVGVNVPNATVMIVEDAQRFGLAQLHQLRGRVGRGDQESWCFLVGEPNERLKLLASTTDGFKIAEKDMEMRGPGDLFGSRQSGAVVAGIFGLLSDTALIKITHDEARRILAHPENEESAAVIRLARDLLERKLCDIAMN